ncbi:uncharacterized protein BKA55DRAFT_539816 [Fusarium redolens]|uniref:Uncharacterized protein n=1 Tax=Fusarium redolens TaxID=48865 RepID=A0A9P9KAL7_FUSRE|nr:uncharacterized protein BKA55DRAFT_539816 [Fusarium redolens]KAH7250260.1 hypothetical protein BKA55DRAFT_539816 [Fusarium redolens]
MSSNQDNTEAREDTNMDAQYSHSSSSSSSSQGEFLPLRGESPVEPERQTAETDVNQQSHEIDTGSLVAGFEGLQVQSNPTHNQFQACEVRIIMCPLCTHSLRVPRPLNQWYLIRFHPEFHLSADLFVDLDNRLDADHVERTTHFNHPVLRALYHFTQNPSYDSVSFYCCRAAGLEGRCESAARGW